jgi:uncharacterized protein involved in exopolysaccharide biosynthesis
MEKESADFEEPLRTYQNRNEELNFIDYIRVLYKYRTMIILICVIVVVTTAIVSLLLPKTYSATVTIVPPLEILQKESDVIGGLGGLGAGSILGNAINVTSVADMYVGILQSRAVVDAIIDRFELMKEYRQEQFRSGVREKLRNNTNITVSDEGIVHITVEDREPKRVAAIANAYVEELDQQNKRLSTGQATSKRIFLENRLKEVEKKLSEIDNILSREAKVQEMLYELLIREYEIAKIEEAKSMPTIQILDNAIPPEKKCKPKRRQMVKFSAAAAFAFAVILAFIREYVSKIKSSELDKQEEFLVQSGQQKQYAGDSSDFRKKRTMVASQRRKNVHRPVS